MYRTQYSYTPPADPMGKICLTNCQNSKNQCTQMRQMQENQSRMQVQQCETNANINYQNCVKVPNAVCQRADCSYLRNSVIALDCQGDYNACYQNCGGSVRSQQVCVANC
jgi:hypothetical protein